MEALAQFGLNAGRPIGLHWPVLLLLICLSGGAGAVLHRLQAKWRVRERSAGSAVDELAMLRTLVANLPDPIYAKDTRSRFVLANDAAAKNMGAERGADLVGKTDFDFFPKELAAGFFEDERRVLVSGHPQVSKEEVISDANGETRFLLSTKVPIFDAAGKPAGLVGVGRNITARKTVEAELRRVQEELEFKATHDSLTLLLNRGAILDMLAREVSRSVRSGGSLAILLADVDHFKNVNDTHGHPIGDDILREVARRLLGAVRAYDLAGRYGGEEFLIVLPDCGASDALARADQLRAAIAEQPMLTAQGPISTAVSIGVIVAQDWGQPTSETILREVDNALYAAKASGRNCCKLAVPSVQAPPAG